MTANTISENALLSLLATAVIALAILVGWCAGGAASDFVAAHRTEAEATMGPRGARIPLAGGAQPVSAGAAATATSHLAKTRREVPVARGTPAAPQFEASR